MNNQSRYSVFPLSQVFVLLVIVSSILTMVALVSGSKAAAVGDSPDAVALSLTEFATGLKNITSMTNAGTGDDRLYVTEKAGRIKIVEADGTVKPEPFLDISDLVYSIRSETGFLGLAFHPDYANNRYFYVNYTIFISPTLQTRISRFEVSGNPYIPDKSKEEILLTVTQPGDEHNAGDIHFGPDGYLYIPLGDGEHGGDRNNNAQDLSLLLGKVVRIDVDSKDGNSPADCYGDGSGNYRIPETDPKNPFIDGLGGTCDEIWASGLRNPWRSSFDRETGDFYIADVGQREWEEINFQPANSIGGENYGWRCYEGNHPFNTSGCGDMGEYVFPIFEYAHADDPCSGSVTGGYVYRGSKFPALTGRYFMADFCKGNFWDLERTGDKWQRTEHLNLKEPGYSSFGEDSSGEIYLANMLNGNVYLLEGPPPNFDGVGYLPLISN